MKSRLFLLTALFFQCVLTFASDIDSLSFNDELEAYRKEGVRQFTALLLQNEQNEQNGKSYENRYIFSLSKKDDWIEERLENTTVSLFGDGQTGVTNFNTLATFLRTHNSVATNIKLYVCVASEWSIALRQKMDPEVVRKTTDLTSPYTKQEAGEKIQTKFTELLNSIFQATLKDYQNSSLLAVAKFYGTYNGANGEEKQHGFLHQFKVTADLKNRSEVIPSFAPYKTEGFYGILKGNVENAVVKLQNVSAGVTGSGPGEAFYNYYFPTARTDEEKRRIEEIRALYNALGTVLLDDYSGQAWTEQRAYYGVVFEGYSHWGYSFEQYRDALKKYYDDFKRVESDLKNVDSQYRAVLLLNKLTDLQLKAIPIDLRIKAIKALATETMIGYFNLRGSNEEKLGLRLLQNIQATEIGGLHARLLTEQVNGATLFERLLIEYNDLEVFGGDGNNGKLCDVLISQSISSKGPSLDHATILNEINSGRREVYYWKNRISKGTNEYFIFSTGLNGSTLSVRKGIWFPNNWDLNREYTTNYHPLNEWVVFFPLDDFPAIGLTKGKPYVLPSVILHYLVSEDLNSSNRKAIYTGIDIASVALGAGALTAGSKFYRAVAIVETLAGTSGLVLDSFEDAIAQKQGGPEFLKGARFVILVAELTTAAISVTDLLKNLKKASDDVMQFDAANGNAVKSSLSSEQAAEYDKVVNKVKEFKNNNSDIWDDLANTGDQGDILNVANQVRYIAKSTAELTNHLNNLKTLPGKVVYKGDFIRSIDKTYHPTPHPELIDPYATTYLDHRYSKVGESGYYASETVSGNATEMNFKNGVPAKYAQFKYEDVQIDGMLNLMDEAVRRQLGVTEEMIRLLGDEKYTYSHILGTWANTRYKGIIYPGAQLGPNYKNVVIFKQVDVNEALQGLTVKILKP